VLVGNTESAGHAVPFSEQFVGGRWHLLTAAAKAPPNAELVSVSCPAVNRCIATGGATTHSGRQVPLAEEWNGTKWRVLTLAGPLSPSLSVLDHVSCTGPNACLAVGNVGMRTLAEIWNGSRWRILATPG
jgi:hypothetical protein